MKLIRNAITILVFLFAHSWTMAQNAIIHGILNDEFNNTLSGAKVVIAGTVFQTSSKPDGSFSIENIPFGDYTIEVSDDDHALFSQKITINKPDVDAGKFVLVSDIKKSGNEELPTVTLSDDDLRESGGESGVSSVLSASRDPFASAATFTFSTARYRVRGYEAENFETQMNGIPMFDMVNGRTVFSAWSGLNDVTRSRENAYGLAPTNYSFGGIGGTFDIDSRASRQRRQFSISYANANRAYENRFMVTYGTGLLPGGWSFATSLTRRWAEEGYIPGTFYDGWSYFFSAEKTFGKHAISLTRLGSHTINGRPAPAVSEIQELAGTHYYNPNWGYQNGKKRNAVVGNSSVPVTILTHEWTIDNRSSLETAVSYLYAKEARSGLDWYNAVDPRPDYYRKLPSYRLDPDVADTAGYYQTLNLFQNNENIRQINWDQIYNSNYNSDSALYVLMERTAVSRTYTFNTVYNNTISDHFSLTGGLTYQNQSSDYFKRLVDLLGGTFFVNLNQFADETINPGSAQNDLDNPNQRIYVGDKYGYDYTAHISFTSAWAQGVFKFDKTDWFAALKLSNTTFYRTGNVRNGVFADKSKGDSRKESFTNYAAKGGVTYKLNGRNYLYANGLYMTRAPFFEDAFISPSTQNTLANDLTDEKIFSVEGGYKLQAPRLKARATGYLTEFKDQTITKRYYNDDVHSFVNYTITEIDKRHLGVELAAEAALGKGLSASAVASLSQFFHTNRPLATILADNNDSIISTGEIIYAKNHRVGGSPEDCYTLGLSYRSPQFWFVYLNANYFDGIYTQFNPARRTLAAIDQLDKGSDQRNAILEQEKLEGQFTLDASIGWSWKLDNKFKNLKYNTFLVFNLGVTNILNNKDLVVTTFEQLRVDYGGKRIDKFNTKYVYAPGTSFFANVALRFN